MLYKLNDVFGYQDANDIKRFWASETAPVDVEIGEIWCDIGGVNPVLKRWNNTWQIINATIPDNETFSIGNTGGIRLKYVPGSPGYDSLQSISPGGLVIKSTTPNAPIALRVTNGSGVMCDGLVITPERVTAKLARASFIDLSNIDSPYVCAGSRTIFQANTLVTTSFPSPYTETPTVIIFPTTPANIELTNTGVSSFTCKSSVANTTISYLAIGRKL